MMQKSNIVKMEERHIEELARLERECFSSPWSEKMLAEELTNSCANFYVWEDAGKVCGYVGLHKILDEGYMTNVAVFPEFRRRGIARKLLEHLFATHEDLSFITLEVRISNHGAIALYESMGFEQVAVRPNYYTKPEEDALLMTKYKEMYK